MEESKKFGFAMPQICFTSSVFLTPPFSDDASSSKTVAVREMDKHHFPLIKNLVLSPTTPVKPEDAAADLDIIGSLYLQGYPLVVEKIFDYLPQSDLLNCLLVCSHWKTFCTSLKPIAGRLPTKPEKLPLTRKQDENQVVVNNFINQQMVDRVTMLAVRKSNSLPQTPSGVSNKSSPTTRRTKCPNCSSPAKEYTFVHAECSSCSHSFCPLCLGKAHKDDLRCAKKISPSKRHLRIGTKQSQKRLRRL